MALLRLVTAALFSCALACSHAETSAPANDPTPPAAPAPPPLAASATEGELPQPPPTKPIGGSSDAGSQAQASGAAHRDAGSALPQAGESPRVPDEDTETPYQGTHKLGVNRVTDMARTGAATFSRAGGELMLNGRVARGNYWLELSGQVEPKGRNQFVLTGVVKGIPNMAWAGEAPRERRTEGRFGFEVKHGRPYWRLYQVNGRPCVCDDDCGNDFCYIDIELAPDASAAPAGQL